jgi:hypothetical protein
MAQFRSVEFRSKGALIRSIGRPTRPAVNSWGVLQKRQDRSVARKPKL